jgi:hypothetical protein
MTTRLPPLPERVRRIGEESFAFIPHPFLREGFFASLTHEERSLYLFLVLASDRQGVSFYGYDRICSVLEVPLESYLAARNGLIDKDLIAFDGRRFQVLSLPERPLNPRSRPLVTQDDLERDDGATIRAVLASALGGDGEEP